MKQTTIRRIDEALKAYRAGGEESPSDVLGSAARLTVRGAIVRLVAFLETPEDDRTVSPP